MIVFDGSGSMAEMGFNDIDEPRIFDARRAVARTIPEIARNRRIGLLVYGPGSQDGCSGIDLRFPPIEDAAPRILSAVNTLQPAGETPLTAAVAKAVRTLNDMSAGGTIVLFQSTRLVLFLGKPKRLRTGRDGVPLPRRSNRRTVSEYRNGRGTDRRIQKDARLQRVVLNINARFDAFGVRNGRRVPQREPRRGNDRLRAGQALSHYEGARLRAIMAPGSLSA
jgi:hypothetical protein